MAKNKITKTTQNEIKPQDRERFPVMIPEQFLRPNNASPLPDWSGHGQLILIVTWPVGGTQWISTGFIIEREFGWVLISCPYITVTRDSRPHINSSGENEYRIQIDNLPLNCWFNI